MGEIKNAFEIFVGKPEGKNHLGDLGVDVRITLKWILDRIDGIENFGCS
jgi:hypothetical protein